MNPVGFDLDGVLVNTLPSLLEGFRQTYGVSLDAERQIGFGRHLDEPAFGSKVRYLLEKFNQKSNTFWLDLPDIDPLVTERVAILSKEIPIYFITARCMGDKVWQQTLRWLTDRRIEPAGVICTDKKSAVIRALGISCFLEDKYENFVEINKWGRNCTCCLVTTPYNKNYNVSPILRVRGVDVYINRLEEGITDETTYR